MTVTKGKTAKGPAANNAPTHYSQKQAPVITAAAKHTLLEQAADDNGWRRASRGIMGTTPHEYDTMPPIDVRQKKLGTQEYMPR